MTEITEKTKPRPGVKLMKIGVLIIGIGIVLAILSGIFGAARSPLIYLTLFMGFLAGCITIVIGFFTRLFAALEKR